ncbi:hypothetical protein [Janthinobacterium sp.]|uniref:hypothetical protein n=1 Tax=Janthinobacterium sp. TaxID=1871054 RepID=UPI0025B8F466|nr:hypothetical protein [Janthinobacterium sp.]
METSNEEIRRQFSERLQKEFIRAGLTVSSPTQLAKEFNERYPSSKVAAQTVRKWLLADAIPTQAKLLALADWLSVSPQWLRYGIGKRTLPNPGKGADKGEDTVIVVGHRKSELVQLVEVLMQLSPENIRLVEGIAQCVLRNQQGKA